MKHLCVVVGVLCLSLDSWAGDVFVRGFMRSDGTYVEGYHRSSPNSYKWDNYSSYPNRNPYTGQKGYSPSEIYPYGAIQKRSKDYSDYRLNKYPEVLNRYPAISVPNR